ncbi:class IV lanthionine synthetase LanL [Actinokineospora sp. NBRC 105648]|uniref:class IV lanthionine synthetase LanL n=1 Tax=Actinokineospora sp. NBRC 105648 TaxID=3032206 RepID=UPI0024A01B4D|nr:class IV lanthionine synthetase LanL [Actinokineospora sp. NBRC 105648]GLZ41132.1 serine/threonine protein kinase [Actinokineospora sp. NBRC 105648]
MSQEDAELLADCAGAVLARHEPDSWRHHVDDHWHYVLPVEHQAREQGWKLHVPATPLSAFLVLARSIEVLAAHRCAFKFPSRMRRLHELVGPNADRKAAGKFLTVYPNDDDHARAVAEDLHNATLGLPGQWILTDRRFRAHSQVFYRYGAFTPEQVLTNDGEYRAVLRKPDGTTVSDQRGVGQVAPDWVSDPFHDDTAPPTVPQSVLIGGRFRVREAIRQSNRGGVYVATDPDGADLILKRFREHTGAAVDGSDSRTRARAEARLLGVLGPSGASPRFIDIFTSGTDIFVAQERIDGIPLRRFVAREQRPTAAGGLGLDPALALDFARQLVELLGKVHAAGYVLGDLTPNNLLVTPDRRLVLIDLESALRPTDVAPRLLTPGYAPPEEEGRTRTVAIGPAPAADLYGLGATLFYLASGEHPPACKGTRLSAMIRLMADRGPAAAALAPLITELIAQDPDQRPGLDAVRTALDAPAPLPPRPELPTVDNLVEDMLAEVVQTADPSARFLWRNSETASRYDPCSVHVGAPGVLLVLCQALRAGIEVAETVQLAAQWTVRRLPEEPRVLPGLLFGRAGTAVSLYEAGDLLGDDDVRAAGLDLARRLPTTWNVPDVFHGVAGAGLALLNLWRRAGADDLLARARECADGLVGGGPMWTATGDFALAGKPHWGFAHGTAGIGTFMLEVASATGDERYLVVANECARALAEVAIIDGAAAFWPSGEDDEAADTVRLTGFCSGATGVGGFFLRHWAVTGEARSRELAEAAAVAVRCANWTSPPLWCHGLATDGDFLLDCAELLGSGSQGLGAQADYRSWAADTAEVITARAVRRRGRLLTPDDTGDVVASFANGHVGALSFLLRLRHGGDRPLFPVHTRDSVPA